MKGLLNLTLFLICVDPAVLRLGADSSSSTARRPPAMAEPTSETLFIKASEMNNDVRPFSSFSSTTSTTSSATMSTEMSTTFDSTKKDDLPPFIKFAANSSIITSGGQTVYLHCLVENLGDRQVSWIRRSDLKILTIGHILYTKDNRFLPIHDTNSNLWILKLSQAQVDDSGDYECQVSYHDDMEKKLKMPFSLTVLDSRAYIHDSPDLYVQRGSKLQLTCYVRDSSDRPDFVYWYHNRAVLNYSPLVNIDDLTHPNQSGPQTSDILVSRLSIIGVTRNHSGNYTCSPAKARPTSIMVHVVDDESGPAAMQHGTGSPRVAKSHQSTIFTAILLTVAINQFWGISTRINWLIRPHRSQFTRDPSIIFL